MHRHISHNFVRNFFDQSWTLNHAFLNPVFFAAPFPMASIKNPKPCFLMNAVCLSKPFQYLLILTTHPVICLSVFFMTTQCFQTLY